jgi:hypothetical protein
MNVIVCCKQETCYARKACYLWRFNIHLICWLVTYFSALLCAQKITQIFVHICATSQTRCEVEKSMDI